MEDELEAPTRDGCNLVVKTQGQKLERVMGIEPTFSAWEADVLPLNYTRLKYVISSAARNLEYPG